MFRSSVSFNTAFFIKEIDCFEWVTHIHPEHPLAHCYRFATRHRISKGIEQCCLLKVTALPFRHAGQQIDYGEDPLQFALLWRAKKATNVIKLDNKQQNPLVTIWLTRVSSHYTSTPLF
ncbi:hypothetical protein [uncultured Paraglaciecola sp.]|uniref:hypothetical protein n=1 Tax=uncultured Paraglaciecola sp. TaxID=1765024 RepID=UPI00261936D6|nr:hypothetical protein [uncultured Paraglaciecola sp.]